MPPKFEMRLSLILPKQNTLIRAYWAGLSKIPKRFGLCNLTVGIEIWTAQSMHQMGMAQVHVVSLYLYLFKSL